MGKKNRQPDFQKVKFKVGKKRPKNLNETRATFKAKTLVLKQQFELEKVGPVSHRNLSWKELLAHLGHYNKSIKLDALSSLREMITQNADLIVLEFSSLLENLCPLFYDRDYKVRESAMLLLKTLIQLPYFSQNPSILRPFYYLISVHLSSAMTNIVEEVQASSLKLLDILVDNMPRFIQAHAHQIFQNFIDQISKTNLKGDKRTLKNDPMKLTSTQEWRHKVLNRLHSILLIVNKKYDQVETVESQEQVDTGRPIEFDRFQTCFWTEKKQFEPKSLRLFKGIGGKKDLSDASRFFESYAKVISPLLIDCWIESKPEDKNTIDNYQSLGIMHSVLSILNLLQDTMKADFMSLTQYTKSSKTMSSENYLENLFLDYFPYSLSDGIDYPSDAKRQTNQMITSNTINLLMCKLCSSSLLKLSEERLFKIFEYTLGSITPAHQQDKYELSQSELIVVLKLCTTIFSNFSTQEIIKPFVVSFVAYFDHLPLFSQSKLLMAEFLCREFCENKHMLIYDNLFMTFYKKCFKYLIALAKETKADNNKLELLIDWIRRIIISQENKSNGAQVLAVLEDDYMNLLNGIDFEAKILNDSVKKKVLELIYWLPKVNRYLLSKLSILILNKNIDISCVNQILNILKLRNESNRVDQSNLLMFLTGLFNGYSGFDLMHNMSNTTGEFYIIDHVKLDRHIQLCEHLENFIGTFVNSDLIIGLLLTTSLPVLSRLPGVYCSTLYGTLSLVAQVKNFDKISLNHDIIDWLAEALVWLLNKQQAVKIQKNNAPCDLLERIDECLSELIRKMMKVLNINDHRILIKSATYLVTKAQSITNLDLLKRIVNTLNFLLSHYSIQLRKDNCQSMFLNLYNVFKELDSYKYNWWLEFKAKAISI